MFGRRQATPPIREPFPMFNQRSPFIHPQQQQLPKTVGLSMVNKGTINKGINGLNNILGYTQQFLRVVETTSPIIQEYGPMIKNLPAMYKMVKAFKEINDETEADVEKVEDVKSETTVDTVSLSNPKRDGISLPKLYI
ncbi:VrrA/YqfQ family protein [Oceanobacillus sp. CAU 1775]